MILVVIFGGTFGLEQPRNSHLEFYPMFNEFLDLLYRMRCQSAAAYNPIQQIILHQSDVYIFPNFSYIQKFYIYSPMATRTFVCPSRYFESDGGWRTMLQRHRNATSDTAILHTFVCWTKVFCNGRIGVATDKRFKQQCLTNPKVVRLATRGPQPSRKLRSWVLVGQLFSTLFSYKIEIY